MSSDATSVLAQTDVFDKVLPKGFRTAGPQKRRRGRPARRKLSPTPGRDIKPEGAATLYPPALVADDHETAIRRIEREHDALAISTAHAATSSLLSASTRDDDLSPWFSAREIPGLIISESMYHKAKPESQYQREEVELLDLPSFFDKQYYDWNRQTETVRSDMLIQFLDPAGTGIVDLRARRIRLRTESTWLPSSAVVLRSHLICNSCCQYVRPPGKPGSGSVKTCAQAGVFCDKMLTIEVRFEQLTTGKCTVYWPVEKSHPPCPDTDELKCSPFIRNLLFNSALPMGMTVSGLKNQYNTSILLNPLAKKIDGKHTHRRPKAKDFEAAVVHANRRARLHSDPLVAIEIIQEANPGAFIDHQFAPLLAQAQAEYDAGVRELHDDWDCIIAPRSALEHALLYALDVGGIFCDSSWRNKNDQGCPLTIISTINEYWRAVPICAMVSAHADEAAYTRMFKALKRAVEQYAREILADNSLIIYKHLSDRALANARTIVDDADGFFPALVMIDRAYEERNAAVAVWPGVRLRVCQYHFIHAVRSVALRCYGRDEDGYRATDTFLDAIRKLQRCTSEKQWPTMYAKFRERISSLAPGEDGPKIAAILELYLAKDWFCPNWLEHIMDFGLPDFLTRDGPWSTNNYAEAMFRTVDRVFLGFKSNKRLDRLVDILINNFFVWYAEHAHQVARPDRELVREVARGDLIYAGNSIWSRDTQGVSIRGETIALLYEAEYKDPTTKKVITHLCGYLEESGREYCTCEYNAGTGKRCGGLWALKSYELLGGSRNFEYRGALIREAIQQRRLRNVRPAADDEAGDDMGKEAEDEEIRPDNRHDDEDMARFWEKEGQPVVKGNLFDFDIPVRGPLRRDDRDYPRHSPPTRRFGFSPPSSAEVRPSARPAPRAAASTTAQSARPSMVSPGRPAEIRPKEDWRARGAKSSMNSAKHRPSKLNPPTRGRNHGNQCYALALLHILCRDETFVAIIQEIQQSLPAPLRLIETLSSFSRMIQAGNEVVSLPEMTKVLHEAELADNPGGTQDPSEVFARLVDLLHRLTSNRRLITGTFEYRLAAHCSACDRDFWTDDAISSVLLVRPQAEGAYPTLAGLISEALVPSNFPPGPCESCLHVEPPPAMGYHVVESGILLTVSIVWGSEGYRTGGRRTGQFLIAPDLDVGSARFEVIGVVSYLPGSVGHYRASIRQERAWWCIDDGRADQYGDLDHVWQGLWMPTLVFYRRAAPTSAVGAGSKKHSRRGVSSQAAPGSAQPGGASSSKEPPAKKTAPAKKSVAKQTAPAPAKAAPSARPQQSTSSSSRPKPTPGAKIFQLASSDEVARRMNAVEWNPVPNPLPENSLLRFETEPLDITCHEWRDIMCQVKRVCCPGGDWIDISINGSRYSESFKSLLTAVESDTTLWHVSLIDILLARLTFDVKSASSAGLSLAAQGDLLAMNGESLVFNENLDPVQKRTTTKTVPFGPLRNMPLWRQSIIPLPTLTKGTKEGPGSPPAHIGTFSIIAPAKMVVWYEGLDGDYTHADSTRTILGRLEKRMLAEAEESVPGSSVDNRGWIFAEAGRDVRQNALLWIRQTDGYSCGPLALLSAEFLLRGIRPSGHVIGLGQADHLTPLQCRRLRSAAYRLLLRSVQNFNLDRVCRDAPEDLARLIRLALG